MKRPRIRLIYPDGAVEHYDDCVISDSLIPDLSFVGTNIITEEREKVVTNLTYKIVSEPPIPVCNPPESIYCGQCVDCKAMGIAA